MPFAIERNDLTKVAADAVVVAANERLQITGGVGLTVARAAGLEELQAACDEIGFCPCGSAVATPAFRLRAKVVVHAVGPVWQGGELGEADFLRSAYDAALECAVSEGAQSIAMPLISAGTYGFPADVSLAVARESIRAFLNRHDDVDVKLVLYSRESVTAGMAAYLDIAEYVDDHYVDMHPAGATMRFYAADWDDGRMPAAGAAPQPVRASKRDSRGFFERFGSALSERRQRHAEEAASEPLGDSAASASMPAPSAGPMEGSVSFASMPAPSAEPLEDLAAPARMPAPSAEPRYVGAPSVLGGGDTMELAELLDALDAPFSTTLLALIDERGMTDAQVYKRANMSRQLFSKIRSDANYRPTKKTALALAVALGLDLDETASLLARAGFALSRSNKADVIVEYFIGQGNYDIFEINEALYAFDQPLL